MRDDVLCADCQLSEGGRDGRTDGAREGGR